MSKKISEKRKKEAFISQLSEYLSGPALEFVSTRVHMGQKKNKWWSARDKSVALSLFHASPKAYRLIKKIYALPGVNTLRRTTRQVQVYQSFCDNIWNCLKQIWT